MSKFSDALKKIQSQRDGQSVPRPPISPVDAHRSSLPPQVPVERREFQRFRCFAFGHVVIDFPAGDAIIGTCTILNFSNKGILFDMDPSTIQKTPETMHAHAKIRITADKDSPDALEVEGYVIRAQVLGRIQVAVQFKEAIPRFCEDFRALLKE